MIEWIRQIIPPQGIGLIIVLFLSLMIGLEQEEKRNYNSPFFFGGIRTYPLIAISGYLLTVISPKNLIPFTAGLLVLGALLGIVYWSKIEKEKAGFTTEISALATYVLGGVVGVQEYWLAVAVGVLIILLIHMKIWLEEVAQKIPTAELATFAKFLIITAVILPLLPDKNFTRFNINPYKTWLIVIAVSGISYSSYLIQLKLKRHRGVLITALLGGLYSSTVTTVVLAKKSKSTPEWRIYPGGILLASGVMYLRISALLLLFNKLLFQKVLIPFLVLSAVAMVASSVWLFASGNREKKSAESISETKNPLELTTAFIFAFLFLLILIITTVVIEHFGRTGLYSLAALMGITDVDPFIMGLTQTAKAGSFVTVAAKAIVITTASNNLLKGIYALVFGSRKSGKISFVLLLLLSLATFGVLFLI